LFERIKRNILKGVWREQIVVGAIEGASEPSGGDGYSSFCQKFCGNDDRPLIEGFELNRIQIPRQDVLVVIDYSKPSWQTRFYVVDLKTGKVDSYKTSHGRGSDPQHTGRAQIFSNIVNSNMTSLGFFLSGHDYFGQYGKALKMHGLSVSNSKAYERAIVIHGAEYVNEAENWVGRSQGCPALDFKHAARVIDQIKDGALIYSWAN
jgi:hypothetical protein